MKSRKLACQALERRQLLAAVTCPTGEMITGHSAREEGLSVESAAIEPEGSEVELTSAIGQGDYTDPNAPYAIPQPVRLESFIESSRHDLTVENDGMIVTVRTLHLAEETNRSHYEPVLYLFQRNDDNTLTELASETLNFVPRRLIVTDSNVIAVGDTIHGDFDAGAIPQRTSIFYMSRDNLSQRSRLTEEGQYQHVFEKEGRLYLTTYGRPEFSHITFPQPRIPYTLTVLDTDTNSLDQVARGELNSVVTENMISGDDILSVENGYYYSVSSPIEEDSTSTESVVSESVEPPPVSVAIFQNKLFRYRIAGEEIVVAGELELHSGMTHMQFEIAGDGKSAVIAGYNYYINPRNGESSREPLVDLFLIDLSQDIPSVFEQIEINGIGNDVVTEIGETITAISTAGDHVYLINTDQTIDISAENRVTRLDLPFLPDGAVARVSSIKELRPNEFIVMRPIAVAGDPISGMFNGIVLPESLEHDLTLISGDQLAVVSSTQAAGSAFALFHDNSNAPVLTGIDPSFLGPRESRLAALRFNAAGNATSIGSVSTTSVEEIDANEDRLLLRHFDRLTEYRWDDLENPIPTPIGDEVPAPVAVDDEFEHIVHSNDRYLHVLANDQIAFADQLPSMRIVELVDAPDFVTLDATSHLLRLTDDVRTAEGTHEFQYVIERSGIRSTANVRLNLIRFDDGETQQAIQQIVAAAAERLEIPADEIQFAFVHEYISQPMPEITPEGDTNPLGGQYGVIADFAVGDQSYRFAANFQGQVELVSEGVREAVLALSIKAVDADGNALERISDGDTFYLEISADDLRAFGQGVFGVGFDLPLPSNTLTPTGELILLGKWDDYGDPIQPNGIDEFHAIEVLIEHPGSAPQPVVRIGVQAIAGGDITLQLDPADSLGVELLLRGHNHVISPVNVNFGSLELTIHGLTATDIDGSGATTPRDALQIINFLGRHGSVNVSELSNLDRPAETEYSPQQIDQLSRLDTSGDGRISAMDALLVINDIARQFNPPAAEAERVDAVLTLGLDNDDENSEIADEALLLF